MLTLAQVLKMIPVSRMTIYRWRRAGLFPQGHGRRKLLWIAEDVRIWQENQPLDTALHDKIVRIRRH